MDVGACSEARIPDYPNKILADEWLYKIREVL